MPVARKTQAEKNKALAAAHGHAPAVEDAPVEKEEDLDDPQVQDEIMHPKPGEVALSFQTLHLYPFSVKVMRNVASLVFEVQSEAYTKIGLTNQALLNAAMGSTISSLVNSPRRTYLDDILRYAAIATGKPGTVDDAQAQKIAAEFSDKCDATDMVLLFTELTKRVVSPTKNG